MRQSKNRFLISVAPSLISIVLGLFLGWLILFLSQPESSFDGIRLVVSASFLQGSDLLGSLFHVAAPIILTGLSVGFSNNTGLFNMGASGQYTAGAFAAIYLGVKLTGLPPVLHSLLCISAAMAAGAVWGSVAGFLKARYAVSEVISGIMLNYIAMLLVNYAIKQSIYDSTFNRSMRIQDSAKLSMLDPVSFLDTEILYAILAAVILYVVLYKTVLGYELRTIGKNRFAGQYSGMNDQRTIILSMAIAGAVAGLGGAMTYLSSFGEHISVVEEILQAGFTGISVALLGMSHPLAIILSGLFIAQIQVGGNLLQIYGYSPEIINTIIAMIVFCGAMTVPVRNRITLLLRRKEESAS